MKPNCSLAHTLAHAISHPAAPAPDRHFSQIRAPPNTLAFITLGSPFLLTPTLHGTHAHSCAFLMWYAEARRALPVSCTWHTAVQRQVSARVCGDVADATAPAYAHSSNPAHNFGVGRSDFALQLVRPI